MTITDEIRKLIISRANTREMGKTAIGQGMRTLRMSGVRKICQGVTSVDEVARITAGD